MFGSERREAQETVVEALVKDLASWPATTVPAIHVRP